MNNKSVIVKLKGGLGNQLFQLALGLYFKKQNYNCVFDLTTLYKYNHRITTRDCEICSFPLDFQVRGRLLQIMDSVALLLQPFTVKYDQFGSDIEISKKRKVIANGFFQDGVLVDEVISEILDLLVNYEKNHTEYQSDDVFKSSLVLEDRCVAIHVRRGDFENLPSAKKAHGVLSMSYYSDALDAMARYKKIEQLFVFSDDYDWITQNFKSQSYEVHFIKPNHDKPINDLIMLSKFRRLVCANSTFSWWAARIAFESYKSSSNIILPKNWFANHNLKEPNIFRSEWTRI